MVVCVADEHIEVVIWSKVGDILQSCRLKWFMASAESDKFCPLSSTNHCSLSQTHPSSPESRQSRSWSQGRATGRPNKTHTYGHTHITPSTHTHTQTRALYAWIHWLSKGSQSKYSLSFLCFSPWQQSIRKSSLCVFCDSSESTNCIELHKMYISVMLNCCSIPPSSPTYTQTHYQHAGL